jgi:hypothetical protein
MKNYKPRKDSFPYRVIELLYENGETKAEDIRREIGLDEHCKYSIYSDRSSYSFGCTIIPRLIAKGIVERTRRGYYKLKT